VPYARNRSNLRPPLEAEAIEGADAYSVLRDDWQRIADLQGGAILFQTHELLSAWTRHFPSKRLVTIVVRDRGRPVLIWPLTIERQFLVRVACGAGAPIGQYGEVLLDPDTDGIAAFEAALEVLKASVRPDLVVIERVRADSALRAVLHDAAPVCWAEAAPFTDLSQGADSAIEALKPSAMRKQRKRVRRFQKQGRVRFGLATDPGEAEAWLNDALDLKRAWLKATGRVSRAFVRAESGECLAELARTLWRDGRQPRMIVARLSLDGKAAAYEAGFRHGDVFYVYLRAFAPELAVLGPGNVLTEHMLRWCAENGVGRYDMMAPRSRNKSEWQSSEVAVLDFALPMTPGGSLFMHAGIKRLGPALRAAFYALPTPLRSMLAGLTIRA
jgi:CelD/BcsL family acetyltransferase involved in cellulose biosynthesis